MSPHYILTETHIEPMRWAEPRCLPYYRRISEMAAKCDAQLKMLNIMSEHDRRMNEIALAEMHGELQLSVPTKH